MQVRTYVSVFSVTFSSLDSTYVRTYVRTYIHTYVFQYSESFVWRPCFETNFVVVVDDYLIMVHAYTYVRMYVCMCVEMRNNVFLLFC